MGTRESRVCSQKPLAVPLILEGDEACTLSHTLHIAMYVQNKGFFIEPWPVVHALDCEPSPVLLYKHIVNSSALTPSGTHKETYPERTRTGKKLRAEALVP